MKTNLLTEEKQNCGLQRKFARPGFCIPGIALLFCAMLFHPVAALALGTRIPNQDPEAIARGNAFVATADNPSAIYYNPAGITQLDGVNAQFGTHIISINSTYEAPGGGTYHSKFGVQAVPEFYLTDKLKDYPISLGFGIYAPYGLAIHWPDNVPFKMAGMQAALTYVSLNPVVAWKVCDQLSIAAGPTFNVAQVMFRQAVDPAGDKFQFHGDDHDFGYTAGLMWQPVEKWSFGANYHSATKMNFSGTSSALGLPGGGSTTAEFPFAQFVMGGISFRPTTNWNFEADVDWTQWHALSNVQFNGTPFGSVNFPFHWKSSFMVGVGGTRYLDNGYFASAGYFFSQNSTSEGSFNPLIPDTDLHVGSLGFGHKGQHWSWTLAAQIITGPPRTVATDSDFPTANGRYQWMNGAFNFSIGYHF